MFSSAISTVLLLSASLAVAQLSGNVGPTTTTASKREVTCNVLDHGGTLDSSDIGPAIGSAFKNCVLKNPASTLYVPPGNYGMKTWQTLIGGSHWAFQMDGVITRTGIAIGNMIMIKNTNDFEFFSSTSAGAFQGYGYLARNAGPRIVRIVTSTNWSLHDLIFVDSPEYHIVIQGGSNGEIYNIAIRGANIGGSDGIDITGVNHWVHDVEVTNRDECVTVKSPASNLLIERIWCNQSGGSAIGSLIAGTSIENILYRNVYTNGGNQMFMIKSWGGDGHVNNVLLQNFTARGTAHGLDVNQYWPYQVKVAGSGVKLTNITVQDWDGLVVDGVSRPTIQIFCADGAPCEQMVVSNVNLWSATGKAINKCQSAYGVGSCLAASGNSSYAITTMTISKPAGYTMPATFLGDLSAGFATNSPIPIPTIPTMYYPGLPQISPLARNL